MSVINTIIADDHPATVAGLAYALDKAQSINVVCACRNSTELLRALDIYSCDVVISDYIMPGGNCGDGISLFTHIRKHNPHIKLIALTMVSNPTIIRDLLSTGIFSILSKSDALEHVSAAVYASLSQDLYLSPTIRTLIGHKSHHRLVDVAALSPREIEVVSLFTSGLSINTIAEKLQRSKQTISAQKRGAMRKLGLYSDVDLFRYALETALTQ